jgi:hypothetical protein
MIRLFAPKPHFGFLVFESDQVSAAANRRFDPGAAAGTYALRPEVRAHRALSEVCNYV